MTLACANCAIAVMNGGRIALEAQAQALIDGPKPEVMLT